MDPEKTYSQQEILAIIKQIDNENFILANAARMVFFAGFHKNEIENIKIKNVFQNDTVLSEIKPFLDKSRKTFTSMPIFLDQWPRAVLDRHIKTLESKGYVTDEEAYIFPDPKTKKQYSTKKLWRHFNKFFEHIDFDGLRKFGIEREEMRLKVKYKHSHIFRDELLKYSRHSRLTTTSQFIAGKVQKAGKQKKRDLPWEIIVKGIEGIPYFKYAPKNIIAEAIRKIINTRIEEKDIKESLNALLDFYKKEMNIK
jgi:hypothetical protein